MQTFVHDLRDQSVAPAVPAYAWTVELHWKPASGWLRSVGTERRAVGSQRKETFVSPRVEPSQHAGSFVQHRPIGCGRHAGDDLVERLLLRAASRS